MKLLTKNVLALFAKTGDQSQCEDPLVIAKFFTPDSSWTWYAIEYDPEMQIFFGYVIGPFPEWGTFSLKDLKSVRGVLNLPIERDLYFNPKPFSELNLP